MKKTNDTNFYVTFNGKRQWFNRCDTQPNLFYIAKMDWSLSSQKIDKCFVAATFEKMSYLIVTTTTFKNSLI